jgi:hypothetical protein
MSRLSASVNWNTPIMEDMVEWALNYQAVTFRGQCKMKGGSFTVKMKGLAKTSKNALARADKGCVGASRTAPCPAPG